MLRLLVFLVLAFAAGTATADVGVFDQVDREPVMAAPPAAADCAAAPATCSWERAFGGPFEDRAYGIAALACGGFVVAANTRSPATGHDDACLLHLDDTGAIRWERVLGGGLWDRAMAIQAVPGGGFVLAGTTTTQGFGYEDVWVLCVDANGRL